MSDRLPDPDATLASTDGRNGKPAPTSPPASGARRYRSVRLHARGSLGQVHVARDEELNREVALKELQDHCADDLDSRLRFQREAEITAALEHPGIVPVYGRGHQADGRPFYAMRFVRGESLDDAIRRYHESSGDRLAFSDLLSGFVAICNAIAYAHTRGVIHRDLKPGNIMLGPFGETLVVDWGLARHFDRPDGVPPSDDSLLVSPATEPTATHAGQVVGTPAYMSPEQSTGREKVGPASDIYSLGGILYSILTGQPPIARAVAAVLLLGQVDRTPPAPHLVKKDVSPALEAVCVKAMARHAEDRYSTADELGREVLRWLADEPVNARPDPPLERWSRWSRRHRSLVTGFTALLVAGLIGLTAGLWAVSRERVRTAQQRDEAALQRDEAVRAEGRAEQNRELAEQHRELAERNRELAEQAQGRAEANLQKEKAALAEARKNLEQADRNLLLARKAVDDCYVLVHDEQLLGQEIAAPFRRRLLKAALPYYREFTSRKPGEAAFDLDLARNLTRVATIESELGERDEARGHADRARTICAALSAKNALSGDELQKLADCVNNIGSVYHALGTLPRAAQMLDESRKLQERLVKQRPDDFRAPFHLIKTNNNLGLVERERGRTEIAQQNYDRALKLAADLLLKYPESVELLSLNVTIWRGKASLLGDEGQLDPANRAFVKGEEVGERLLKLRPLSPENARTVATTYSDHAALLSNQRKPADALPLFQKAIALQEAVCRAQPESRHLHDLGIMTSNLGRVYYLLKKPDEELAAWDRSRRTWAELAARRPRDEAIAGHHQESWRHWVKGKVYRIDRLIADSDPVGAREIEQLAAESQPYKPSLVSYTAVCGRWLNAFARSDRVSVSQREAVAAQALAFLNMAKREKLLDEESMQRLRKDKSFDALREGEAFKAILGEGVTKKDR